MKEIKCWNGYSKSLGITILRKIQDLTGCGLRTRYPLIKLFQAIPMKQINFPLIQPSQRQHLQWDLHFNFHHHKICATIMNALLLRQKKCNSPNIFYNHFCIVSNYKDNAHPLKMPDLTRFSLLTRNCTVLSFLRCPEFH